MESPGRLPGGGGIQAGYFLSLVKEKEKTPGRSTCRGMKVRGSGVHVRNHKWGIFQADQCSFISLALFACHFGVSVGSRR